MADINTSAPQIKTIWNRHWVYLLLILLFCLGIYQQSISFDFLTNWDDTFYISENPAIRGFTAYNIAEAFTNTYRGNYAPVQMLSYIMDHAAWGLNPAGFHLTNVVIHAANAALFYILVILCRGSRLTAFTSAVIFAIHPVQAEAVAWVSQRKTLLAVMFFLLSFILYINARQKGRAPRTSYLLSGLAFMLALLSKSVAVVLPFCLLLYELCIPHESNPLRRKALFRLMPYLAIAVLASTFTIFTQSAEFDGGRTGYHGGSLSATILTMSTVLARYLFMLVWPAGLSAVYLPDVKTTLDLEVLLSTSLIAAIIAGGWFLWKQHRLAFIWYGIFFLGLAPVSQIIPLVTLMNDRYLYLPMIGAAGLAGFLASRAERLKQPHRFISYGVLICLALSLAVAAHIRASVWRDSISLWSDTAVKQPDSKMVLSALAESYHNAGRVDEALTAYRQTFSLLGEFADPRQEIKALNNMAVILMDRGLLAEAEPLLSRLVSKYPDNTNGYINLGHYYTSSGKSEHARNVYRQLLLIAPGMPTALMRLGQLEMDSGRLKQAREFFMQALANGGNGPDLQIALARLEARTGDAARAMAHIEQAVRLGLANPARLRLVSEFSVLRELPRFKAISGHGL